MNKQKKILVQLLVFFIIILSAPQVFANTIGNYEEGELSNNYKKYLELKGEQEDIIAPRMYDIPITKMTVTNPLKLGRMLGSTILPKYSLVRTIPENMIIKHQKSSNACWAFASLATLESHLALRDYKNRFAPITYDFSERHMEYATSETFLDNYKNEKGFNREPGDGADLNVAVAYLTNGSGAIPESEMEFVDSTEPIEISAIQGKTISSQVKDTIDFASYDNSDDLTAIIQQIKNHIVNYGGISAAIHAGHEVLGCYNSATAASYCATTTDHEVNHAVTIVGWDDEYSTEEFLDGFQPQNNGAWIIKNSLGTDNGDEGFIYVSYEDANIYSYLTGIRNAQSDVTYENIYQHDWYGGFRTLKSNGSNILYLATIFEKQTQGTEYVTQVAINAPEKYTCKVWINPNGTSKSMDDLQLVQLRAGETETIEAGYHTLEFLEPIEITSDKFVVVLEVAGTQEDCVYILREFNYGEFYTAPKYEYNANHRYDNVTIANDMCFITPPAGLESGEWDNTSEFYEATDGKLPNFDTTIKAFTVSKILENIEIVEKPSNTQYIEGQDFYPEGMIIQANYSQGEPKIITDYAILNNTELQLGQTNVTIAYEGKSVDQSITVLENTVESIEIKNIQTTEYWAGDDFDTTGMIVEATYKDGTKQIITEFIVRDGQNLKNVQTSITIEYKGKTATQAITVKPNLVVNLEITQYARKENYVAGQSFNPEGLEIEATYENGAKKQILDYTILNGTTLQLGQASVTIEYEGKTATQAITVVDKTIISIIVKEFPTKTQYIQNKQELDLTGGIIEISYNDETKEEISMSSSEITVSGFNNNQIGKQTIILNYQNQTTEFDIEIKESPKPENSDFANVQATVERIRAHHFTDTDKEEYIILNILLSNIAKATVNDKTEYYYYLSPNQQETSIANWVKISELQENKEQISFEINTLDISNYQEVSDADNLYLYVREVSTRNNMITEAVSSSILLEVENINIENYIDGEKKTDVSSDTITNPMPGEEPDNTLASGTIPNAGKNILIICLVFIILVIGIIIYLKYKDIEIK